MQVERETDKQTNTEKVGRIERQADRKKDGQTDRQGDTQMATQEGQTDRRNLELRGAMVTVCDSEADV